MRSIVTQYDTEEIEVCMCFSMIYNIQNMVNFCIRVGLRSVLFWVITQRVVIITDVSGQPIGPIFKGIITQKSAVLICFTEEGFLTLEDRTNRLS